MCEICQMQFGFDHDARRAGNDICPRCRRFYIQPQNESCYHCWAEENIGERCDRCLADGAPARLKAV